MKAIKTLNKNWITTRSSQNKAHVDGASRKYKRHVAECTVGNIGHILATDY